MANATPDSNSEMELSMNKPNSTPVTTPQTTTRQLARRSRMALLAAVALLGVFCAAMPAAAQADPRWTLDIHHNQTNFAPGGTADYWFSIKNVGDTDSSGPLTVTLELPPGVTGYSFGTFGAFIDSQSLVWDCPGLVGASTIVCTTNDSITAHNYRGGPIVTVGIVGAASGDLTASATVSGGGGLAAPATAGCPLGAGACATEVVEVSSTPAPFGLVDRSFVGDFFDADHVTRVRQAGAHPDHAGVGFDFNTVDRPIPKDPDHKLPSENVRNLRVDLPAGFLGNPTAVGECTPAQLQKIACPPSSQVGVIDLDLNPVDSGRYSTLWRQPVFNMTHPKGVINDLAFQYAGNPAHIRATLDPARNYAVTTSVFSINETVPVFSQRLTIWGVPADSGHDGERYTTGCLPPTGCPAGIARQPFLTVPFDCAADNRWVIRDYDSWENMGVFGKDVGYDMPGRQTGCDQLRFEPSVSVTPTSTRADSPTGLTIDATVPQNPNPNGLATPPARDIKVVLPEGMTLNPAFAEGLDGCTPAQIGLGTESPAACPDSSRIGSLKLSTPLLPKALEGSMYLAKQSQNPFGTLFAMYVVVHDTEDRGVMVKIPGRIDLDAQTGQITATFDELPQFPFDHLEASFRSGPRAPLVNPPTCGTKTVAGTVTNWSQPDINVDVSSSYTVDQAPGGGACAPSLPALPFAPQQTAGTDQPTAGAFSPFALKLTRNDGEQEIDSLRTDLPAGLTAKLAGVARCSDAAIASIPAAAGTGQAEKANPACPAASRIGYVQAGTGAGSQPFYIPGTVYLAGPYKGAPFSAVVVTPAIAGGFDLGNVVIRAKLDIDRDDAQVHIDSGPIPTIIHGIKVHLRDVRVVTDRDKFTLNPTNCDATRIAGQVQSTQGTVADVGNRFQVGDCASLGLSPKLAIALTGKGQTTDNKHPGVHATVSQTAGQANLKKVVVSLPLSLALDPDNAQALCEFSDGSKADPTCPKGSIVGKAVAKTPILDQPLTGPVYFVKNIRKDPKSGREIRTLPKLVIPLTGENGLRLNLTGTSNVVDNRLVTTFDNIPDAPVSDFTLDIDGGKSGILVVSGTDICKSTQVAEQQIDGQNGKNADADIYLQTPACSLKIISKKVGKSSVAVKIGGLGAGKVTVSGKGIKKTTKTISKSTVATITAKRTKGKPGKVTVSFDPTGPAKARKTTK